MYIRVYLALQANRNRNWDLSHFLDTGRHFHPILFRNQQPSIINPSTAPGISGSRLHGKMEAEKITYLHELPDTITVHDASELFVCIKIDFSGKLDLFPSV